MGNRGRYGKYGEIKRLDRLRRAKRDLPRFLEMPAGPRKGGLGLPTGPSIKIRPGNAGDIGFLRNLSDEAFGVYGPYREMIPQWFESGVAATRIAFVKGKRVGFSMLGLLVEGRYYQRASELLAVAVAPGNQRQGIGQKLLWDLEKMAARHKIEWVVLHTAVENLAARRLFTKHGFKEAEAKSHFYPAGQDAVQMVRRIPASSD